MTNVISDKENGLESPFGTIPGKEIHLAELELYKKLLNFFFTGESYYFITDYPSHSIQISKEIKDVLGYYPCEVDYDFIENKIHPEDQTWFNDIHQCIQDFYHELNINKRLNYKVRYDFRYLKKNGEYARILCQEILLELDEYGNPLKKLSVHTDISCRKTNVKPELSFIGMEGEPTYKNVAPYNIHIHLKDDLTYREKQVLKLLMEGKLSKEVGSILNISKQTVDTHRKNMLHKKHLCNTGELIGKAILQGWI